MKTQSTGNQTKSLGLWTCTALVIGSMIGSGIFLLPTALAPYGSLSIIGWGMTALGALCLALVFARLAKLVPKAGGPYAYTRDAFGDFAGFLIAWGYWIGLWAGCAAVSVALVSYLTVFFPALKTNTWTSGLIAIVLVWLLTLVNCRGVKEAGIVQVITTVLKLVPLVAIAVLGLLWINPAHFTPVNPSGQTTFSALSAVAALTLWSFLGLEFATVPAGHVVNPRKTIPRATIIGTLVAATVYILGMISILGIMPREALAQSSAPFADAARIMFGSWAYYAVGVGAVISCLGTINAFILTQGQVSMAAAQDGLFPRVFAVMSGRGIPAIALVISSTLITILLLLNYSGSGNLAQIFEFIILLATLTTLVPYAFCALAEFLIYFKDRKAFNGQRMVGSGIIGGAAFIYSVWAVFGSGAETVFYGFLLLLLGLPVYVWIRREQSLAEAGDTDHTRSS